MGVALNMKNGVFLDVVRTGARKGLPSIAIIDLFSPKVRALFAQNGKKGSPGKTRLKDQIAARFVFSVLGRVEMENHVKKRRKSVAKMYRRK